MLSLSSYFLQCIIYFFQRILREPDSTRKLDGHRAKDGVV